MERPNVINDRIICSELKSLGCITHRCITCTTEPYWSSAICVFSLFTGQNSRTSTLTASFSISYSSGDIDLEESIFLWKYSKSLGFESKVNGHWNFQFESELSFKLNDRLKWTVVQSKRWFKLKSHSKWTIIKSELSAKATTLVVHVRWSFNLEGPFSFYYRSFCMTVHLEWPFTFDPNLPRWTIH